MTSKAEQMFDAAKNTIVFRADRDAALRTLEPAKLKEFMQRWRQKWPPEWDRDPRMVLFVMHSSRLQILAMTPTEKGESAFWLHQNGFKLPPPMFVKTDEKGEFLALIGAEYQQ